MGALAWFAALAPQRFISHAFLRFRFIGRLLDLRGLALAIPLPDFISRLRLEPSGAGRLLSSCPPFRGPCCGPYIECRPALRASRHPCAVRTSPSVIGPAKASLYRRTPIPRRYCASLLLAQSDHADTPTQITPIRIKCRSLSAEGEVMGLGTQHSPLSTPKEMCAANLRIRQGEHPFGNALDPPQHADRALCASPESDRRFRRSAATMSRTLHAPSAALRRLCPSRGSSLVKQLRPRCRDPKHRLRSTIH
jgi:hypothetical protein